MGELGFTLDDLKEDFDELEGDFTVSDVWDQMLLAGDGTANVTMDAWYMVLDEHLQGRYEDDFVMQAFEALDAEDEGFISADKFFNAINMSSNESDGLDVEETLGRMIEFLDSCGPDELTAVSTPNRVR